jgi:hypothetical protein
VATSETSEAKARISWPLGGTAERRALPTAILSKTICEMTSSRSELWRSVTTGGFDAAMLCLRTQVASR